MEKTKQTLGPTQYENKPNSSVVRRGLATSPSCSAVFVRWPRGGICRAQPGRQVVSLDEGIGSSQEWRQRRGQPAREVTLRPNHTCPAGTEGTGHGEACFQEHPLEWFSIFSLRAHVSNLFSAEYLEAKCLFGNFAFSTYPLTHHMETHPARREADRRQPGRRTPGCRCGS